MNVTLIEPATEPPLATMFVGEVRFTSAKETVITHVRADRPSLLTAKSSTGIVKSTALVVEIK